MSDNKISYNGKDPFSEHFRQRLINNPMPLDASCWDEIEARLPKRRAISTVWIGLAIAASVIVAVFILNNTINKEERVLDYELPEHKEVAIAKESIGDEIKSEEEQTEDNLDNIPQEIVATAKVRSITPIILPTGKKDAGLTKEEPEMIENNVAKDNSIEEKKEEAPIGDKKEEIPVDENKKEPESKKPDEMPAPQKNVDKQQFIGNENLTAYNNDYKRRKKGNNKWHILAGLGSVGNARSFLRPDMGVKEYPKELENLSPPSEQTNDPINPNIDNPNDPTLTTPSDKLPGQPENPPLWNPTDPSWDESNYMYSLQNIQKNQITDKTYSIPLSVGITVRKMLNNRLGIETGIVYTYLSTGFTVNSPQYYTADLNLHYLGVPLNLVVHLWDKKSWNIYASGGGMVEKGLQSVFKRERFMVYDSKKSIEKSSISGLQWSINGGLGVSYNFFKDMNLYVEPGFSYFFDCDQPMSKRTDDPFIFNLRVGLRYDF